MSPVMVFFLMLMARLPIFLKTALVAFLMVAPSNLFAETQKTSKSIAWLSHAGFRLQPRPHCTAFQTRKGRILTSTGCLPDTGGSISHLLFAYDRGEFQRYILARKTRFRTSRTWEMALLCTNTYVNSGLVISSKGARIGTNVTVKGYGVPRRHVLEDYRCKIVTYTSSTTGTLDCPLPLGMLGAPVISDDTGHVSGLIMHDGTDQPGFVAITSDIVTEICEQF